MLATILQLVTFPNLLVFTITLTVVYAIKTWLSHSSEFPPMPCLPLPWLGHSLFLRPTFGHAMMRWTERMGDIYTVYLGSRRFVVISSYDLIYDALVKKTTLFSDRPKALRKEASDTVPGIIMNSGASWKEQRAVSTAILKEFGMGKNSLAEKISEVTEGYMKVLDDFKGQPQDIRMLTNRAVSNVICSILLGKCFDLNDPFLVRFLEINEKMVLLPSKNAIVRILPILRYLPGDLFGVKEYDKVCKELTEMFSDPFIQQFKQELDDLSVDNYIKAYLREMNKRRDAGEKTYLDEPNLRRHIDDLFLAGSETTSSTMLWAYVYAMNFPEIQEKVFREIEDVVGTERLPNLHDKAKLNYVNAFILEIQRYGTIAPFTLPHLCTGTTQLGGYTIPEGTTLSVNIMAVLKDQRIWEKPEAFRPERFLDEHNKIVIPKEFIPFSLGKRICLGESLAKMELFLFLVAIFQTFEILPENPDSPPSMEPEIFGTATPKPFKVRFRRRTSNE